MKNPEISFDQRNCGEFCKNLAPLEQKILIRGLMKEYAKIHHIFDDNLVFVNQSNIGDVGEKKFIVSAGWWRKWCDFANFGDMMNVNTTGMMDSHITFEDFEALTKEADRSNSNSKRRPFSVYESPGMITNKELLLDTKIIQLKENLIEHFDYEVVSKDVWQRLYSWFSADYCISRFLEKDNVNSKKIVLELYPE